MKNDSIKLLERVLRLQRRLSALDIGVRIGVGIHDTGEYFLFLGYKGKSVYRVIHLTDSEIIEKAKALVKPKFKLIKGNICPDILNISVYVKQGEDFIELTVESISREGLLLSDGKVYSKDELYIKE